MVVLGCVPGSTVPLNLGKEQGVWGAYSSSSAPGGLRGDLDADRKPAFVMGTQDLPHV